MKNILALLLFVWLISGSTRSADTFVVKYVSMENVYLNGGESDGLAVGTRLNVIGEGGVKAELEVVYVAAHSASCKVIGSIDLVQVGDRVEPQLPTADVRAREMDSAQAPVGGPVDTVVVKPTINRPRRTQAPVTGNVSMVVYHWNDDTEPNLDFTQATTRLSLKARRLFGEELTLTIRGRGRLDKRAREFSSGIGDRDWSSRVWELAVSYDDPSKPIAASFGRILPRRVGAIGYLDGALIETKWARSLYVGFFGGTSPDWLYDDGRLSLTRTGGYLALVTGSPSSQSFEQSVGVIGEYHAGEVNREFLLVQGRFNRGSSWGFSHSAEFDINRQWRRERAGNSLELSNLYVSSWIRPSDRVRFSVSYDNRTNYRTFESRSIVDSLFDDHLRQGARGQVDVSFPGQIFSSGSIGYRKREGDPAPTWSYAGSLRKAHLFAQGLSLSLQYAGFDGPTTNGSNYSGRISRTFAARYTIGAGYGHYAYVTDGLAGDRTNHWVEVTGQADIGRHYWLGSQLLTESGDDLKGYRIQFELGYRF